MDSFRSHLLPALQIVSDRTGGVRMLATTGGSSCSCPLALNIFGVDAGADTSSDTSGNEWHLQNIDDDPINVPVASRSSTSTSTSQKVNLEGSGVLQLFSWFSSWFVSFGSEVQPQSMEILARISRRPTRGLDNLPSQATPTIPTTPTTTPSSSLDLLAHHGPDARDLM